MILDGSHDTLMSNAEVQRASIWDIRRGKWLNLRHHRLGYNSRQVSMAIISEEPDLRLAGLSIWVLGRQFADYDDYWDGNWLNVWVRVEATGAVVEAQRPIIHVSELVTFATELERLDTTLVGNASLKCTEPNLDVAIQGETHGHATVRIKVTPDQYNSITRVRLFH